MVCFPFYNYQLPRESRTKLLFKATISLTAILVGHDISASRPCVCPEDDPILEDDGADGCTGFGHLWRRVAIVSQQSIPLAVLKTEIAAAVDIPVTEQS